METSNGEFCGVANIKSFGRVEIFTKAGHFGIVKGNKFRGHIKRSALRQAGIYCPNTKKKLYGKHGYVGTVSRSSK